ncbi:hypothetical protein NMG60_11034774 [Bertholletia excelsa]
MVSQSSIQFIDAALFCTSPLALSYADPDQKWIIRDHLLSLLDDFPSLGPSAGTFVHNDGTEVTLLYAAGDLRIPDSNPAVHVTIWVHENYPHMAPVVLVSSNSLNSTRRSHPFVGSSGGTVTPYLLCWGHPRCNLSDLARNLVKIFYHDHPFRDSINCGLAQPYFASKMEAIDRLACSIHYDVAAVRAKTAEDTEGLSILQVQMAERADVIASVITGLEHEEKNLKRRVAELTEGADMLMNWLKVHGDKNLAVAVEDAFESMDEKSRGVLDHLAADRAAEDVMYALEKGRNKGRCHLRCT